MDRRPPGGPSLAEALLLPAAAAVAAAAAGAVPLLSTAFELKEGSASAVSFSSFPALNGGGGEVSRRLGLAVAEADDGDGGGGDKFFPPPLSGDVSPFRRNGELNLRLGGGDVNFRRGGGDPLLFLTGEPPRERLRERDLVRGDLDRDLERERDLDLLLDAEREDREDPEYERELARPLDKDLRSAYERFALVFAR